MSNAAAAAVVAVAINSVGHMEWQALLLQPHGIVHFAYTSGCCMSECDDCSAALLTTCRNSERMVSNVDYGLQQVEQVRKLDAHGSVPYVAEALTRLREEVGNQSTVLGFVGAPFTLATYIVEGGSSKNYTHMKRLMFTQPEVLHAFLTKMADNVADYVRYQVNQLCTSFECELRF